MKVVDGSLSVKISGPAGSGIATLGEILAASFEEVGFYTLVYPEYPSRIRGGDNNIQVIVSSKANPVLREKVDIFLSLDKNLNKLHARDTNKDGTVIENAADIANDIATKLGDLMLKNSVVAGIIWKMFDQPLDVLNSKIKSAFKSKDIKGNLEAAKKGFEHYSGRRYALNKSKEKIIGATGNEVFCKAAISSGCEYASIYPMTPVTSLLNFLSRTKIKIIVPEDEIFASLSVIGASYAGKRALTATSGGGFCLMSEAIGFSSMAEIPLVVILGQRTGPSSGIATYSSQADLNQAIFSTHGDAEKIVLAPGDLREIFSLTQEAFNLADKYQLPVIILTDKYLSESRFSVSEKIFDKIKIKIDRGKRFKKGSKNYRRYEITQDGISPRAYPGETAFLTNSYEHDEHGFSIEDAENRNRMKEKRAKKLSKLTGGFEVLGNKISKRVVFGWGSTKTQINELISGRSDLKYIHVFRPWPVSGQLKKEILDAEKIIVIENNSTGQFANLIRSQTSLEVETILKDDGRPFFKEELAKKINQKI